MSSPSVSIIIPTRNEAENIGPLVSQIVAQGVPFREILFIDDDSTDGTRESIQSLSRSHPIRLIEQNPDEPGLAAAIMNGAAAAEGDLLVVMDADLSHPPDRIKDLLAPLQAGTADMVIGSRYIKGRLDSGVAVMAPNYFPRRLGPRLSPNETAGLDVRFFRNCARAVAGNQPANRRF